MITGNKVSDNMLSNLKGDSEWKEIRTSVKSTIITSKLKRNYCILLFLTIPCLVISEQCQDGKLICTEGKQCCLVNGIETCCEFEVQGEGGSNELLADVTYEIFSNVSMNRRHRRQECVVHCPKGNCCPRDNICCGRGCCQGQVICCDNVCCGSADSCCSNKCCKQGKCCWNGSTEVCCRHSDTCCPDGHCCPYPSICCKGGCCSYISTCCPRGQCCSYLERCCGENCCPI